MYVMITLVLLTLLIAVAAYASAQRRSFKKADAAIDQAEAEFFAAVAQTQSRRQS